MGAGHERENIPATLTEQLENTLYEFLPAGFEINERRELGVRCKSYCLTH